MNMISLRCNLRIVTDITTPIPPFPITTSTIKEKRGVELSNIYCVSVVQWLFSARHYMMRSETVGPAG